MINRVKLIADCIPQKKKKKRKEREKMIMMIISDGEYDDEGAMVEVKVENRSVRTMGCPPNFNSLSF